MITIEQTLSITYGFEIAFQVVGVAVKLGLGTLWGTFRFDSIVYNTGGGTYKIVVVFEDTLKVAL